MNLPDAKFRWWASIGWETAVGRGSHRSALIFSPALLGLGEEERPTRQEWCSIKAHCGAVAWPGRSSEKKCSAGKAIWRGKMRWINLKAIFSIKKRKQRYRLTRFAPYSLSTWSGVTSQERFQHPEMVLDYTESSVKLLEASVVTALCKITVVCLLSIRRTMAESSFTNRLFFPQLPEIPIHRIFVLFTCLWNGSCGIGSSIFQILGEFELCNRSKWWTSKGNV